MERDILISRIRRDPEKFYVVTHGTDTIIETAKYLSKNLHSGAVILIGAKLPEVFKGNYCLFSTNIANKCIVCFKKLWRFFPKKRHVSNNYGASKWPI